MCAPRATLRSAPRTCSLTRSGPASVIAIPIRNSVVAIKPSETDSFVRRAPKGFEVILVYGPDAGLVDERCRALLAAAVPDRNDPFQLVRVGADELSRNPERLLEEAGACPFRKPQGYLGHWR